MLVIGDEQVEAGITCLGAEGFNQLFGDRRYGGVADDDCIDGSEVVDDSEGGAIVFDDTEPPGSVGGVGRFVDTGGYLVADDFDDLIVNTGRDRDISVNPRSVRNGRDTDRREEFGVPVAAFGF
jgi:hypothetical protein